MMTKSVKERRVSVKTLALTAMFAALVTVSTAFIKVPAPLGYAHAGDAIVYLAACLLPPPFGFFAAGIGGATADLLSGYAVFALPTAIIKSLNVLPFFLARIFLKKKQKAGYRMRGAVHSSRRGARLGEAEKEIDLRIVSPGSKRF